MATLAWNAYKTAGSVGIKNFNAAMNITWLLILVKRGNWVTNVFRAENKREWTALITEIVHKCLCWYSTKEEIQTSNVHPSYINRHAPLYPDMAVSSGCAQHRARHKISCRMEHCPATVPATCSHGASELYTIGRPMRWSVCSASRRMRATTSMDAQKFNTIYLCTF